jgi:hypothetical protein
MGKRFNNEEIFLNQEVSFIYEGAELTWFGDYSIRQFGEHPDWDYPGDCETEIEILHTDKIEVWSEVLQDWVNLIPTPSILLELEWEIEKTL